MTYSSASWTYDPLKIATDLLQFETVTPAPAPIFDYLESLLTPLGFRCQRFVFDDPNVENDKPVINLYAAIGDGDVDKDKTNLSFAGHVDVVPVGDHSAWTSQPFGAHVKDGMLYARGAADMKGGVAAWICAMLEYCRHHVLTDQSLSLLITGDEEGPAHNGTKKLLAAIADQGISLSACVTGEPSNPERIGDEIKVGRRGSVNIKLDVFGKQGHIAYPHLADNAVTKLITALHALNTWEIDQGDEFFAASNLEVSNIHVGNDTTNIVVGQASAAMNIRFNALHKAADLVARIRVICDDAIGNDSYQLTYSSNADSFITQDQHLISTLSASIANKTNVVPQLSTKGGTSDSRFIQQYCPVVDFGLVGKTMHQVDEAIAVDDLYLLSDIYYDFISNFLKS